MGWSVRGGWGLGGCRGRHRGRWRVGGCGGSGCRGGRGLDGGGCLVGSGDISCWILYIIGIIIVIRSVRIHHRGCRAGPDSTGLWLRTANLDSGTGQWGVGKPWRTMELWIKRNDGFVRRKIKRRWRYIGPRSSSSVARPISTFMITYEEHNAMMIIMTTWIWTWIHWTFNQLELSRRYRYASIQGMYTVLISATQGTS